MFSDIKFKFRVVSIYDELLGKKQYLFDMFNFEFDYFSNKIQLFFTT